MNTQQVNHSDPRCSRFKPYLDNLEPDAGNITDGVTLTTETSDEDFVVFFDKVETTVIGHEGCDLLAVLDQLNTNALADGRVGLFGLNTNLGRKRQAQ